MMKNILLIISLLFTYTIYADTPASVVIDESHQRIHEGSHFFLTYSVPNIGLMGSPSNMITLSFITGDKKVHFYHNVNSSPWALVRLIRGRTGGGESPTGVLPVHNKDENSSYISSIKDISDTTSDVMSYDATLFTGGTVILSYFITLDNLFVINNLIDTYYAFGDPSNPELEYSPVNKQEIILKKNTEYQISVYSVENVPTTIQLHWYEQ